MDDTSGANMMTASDASNS